MVHWRNLPIALENDQWYDKVSQDVRIRSPLWTAAADFVCCCPRVRFQGGVFSGSATVLTSNGTIALSYSVSTNNLQCLAFPANRSDPDLVHWVKPDYNPIISSSKGAPTGR